MNNAKAVATLGEGLEQAWTEFADRPMLEVADGTWTYAQMRQVVRHWTACWRSQTGETDRASDSFVAVLGHRSASVYQAILSIVSAGKAYVPLNPQFPAARLARMVEAAGVRQLFVCPESSDSLQNLLTALPSTLTLLCTESHESLVAVARTRPHHHWVWLDQADRTTSAEDASSASPTDPAYLLFTSGSTGIPKGVAVTHGNVCAYLQTIGQQYQVVPDDRFSQMFELTFDLSVHDMFVPWLSGACLCVVPARSVMAPAAFIRKHELTMWFSVPSVAMFMNRMRMLKPGNFPSLRASLFCGEALAASLAEQWQQAAPHSLVDNLYGPTEATIAISSHRWDQANSPQQCRHGLVPIGQPFPGQEFCIIDEGGYPVPPGGIGELCLHGSQVTPGYLNDPARTAERFVTMAHDNQRWYRTGDLAQQDPTGCAYFLGRVDSQVQILGHRVELAEIDSVLREAAGTESAVTVAWPMEQGRAEAVYGFLVGDHDTEAILAACRNRLPDYMIPRRLICRSSFPLNSNGKIDRNQLTNELKELMHDAA